MAAEQPVGWEDQSWEAWKEDGEGRQGRWE